MLNNLFTNDIRQTLDQFRRSVDNMFESSLGYQSALPAAGSGESKWAFSPMLESGWDDHYLHLRAIIPGVPDENIHVSVQNNQLVIEGERKEPERTERNAYRQLAYGKFYTALTLPNGLDVDHVNCQLRNGILDIQLPISEASKPRQIQIQTGESRKALSS